MAVDFGNAFDYFNFSDEELGIPATTVGNNLNKFIPQQMSSPRAMGAEEIKTLAFVEGNRNPFPKTHTLLCSKNRPITDLTRIFSERPLIPGLNPQIPRMIIFILTPD